MGLGKLKLKPSYSIVDDTIFIEVNHIVDVLRLLNPNNVTELNTVVIKGHDYQIKLDEIQYLLFKLSQLNIKDLYFNCVDFVYFNEPVVKMVGYKPLNREPAVASISLSLCKNSSALWAYLFPVNKETSMYDNRLPNLTGIYDDSPDIHNTTRRLLISLLENNFRVKQTIICAGRDNEEYEDRHIRFKDLKERASLIYSIYGYEKRNRLGYRRCKDACLTILMIRKFRNSIWSVFDKNIVLMIAKDVLRSAGTKIWTK